MIQIPLPSGAANAHPTFQIQLGDNLVQFNLNWLTLNEVWNCDILVEGVTLAAGITLVSNAELIEVYETSLGGKLYLVGDEPTLDNLGVSNYLVWVGDDE